MMKWKRGAALLCSMLMLLGLIGCGQPKEISLQEAHTKVKEAYGEGYLPSMPYDSQVLETIYGVKPEWVQEMIAEGPAINVQVDTFIGIKATEGNAENVKNALEAYRTTSIENNFNYPMNLPKLEQAQVVQVGDCVFYLLLGGYYEGEDESGAVEYYKQQAQIGVDALKTLE